MNYLIRSNWIRSNIKNIQSLRFIFHDIFIKCVKITFRFQNFKQNLFLSSRRHSICIHLNFQSICWKSCRIMSIYRKHILVNHTESRTAILITVFEIKGSNIPGHSIPRYSYLFLSRSGRRFDAMANNSPG